MKTIDIITKGINKEIDKQVEELKKILEDNYDDFTMDEMEQAILEPVNGIAKSVLNGYVKKKMTNSNQ